MATPGKTGSTRQEQRVTLVVNDIAHLFNAPPANPFTGSESEILGQSGLRLLQRRFKQSWPRSARITKLVLELPAGQLPQEPAALAQLTAQTQAAIRRYCAEQVAANRAERRLTLTVARRQFLIVAAFTAVTLAYGLALVNGQLTFLSPFMQGVIFIVALLAASLALWDALDALLFQWAPFTIDQHAYQVLAGFDLTLTAQAAPAAPAAAVGNGRSDEP